MLLCSPCRSSEDGTATGLTRALGLTKSVALGLLVVSIGATGSVAPAGGASPTTVPSFTAAQAEQGASAYENDCAQCHGANLEGYSGPALTGPQFTEAYGSVSALLGFVSTSMPYDAPGSLSHEDYVAIVAFILGKNGLAAGKTALTYGAGMASKAPIWGPGK